MAMTKYQIFISSTYEDLRQEREHVIKAILEMGHIPVGMEMFSAADDAQWNIIRHQIDQSDYYVVVIANRYGSTDGNGLSYTEKEHDYAVQQSIPAIGFILDRSAPWPSNRSDLEDIKRERLQAFKDKVQTRLISRWTGPEDLSGKVILSLTKLMTERPRPGWVRGSDVPSAEALDELSRLSRENAALRSQVAALDEDSRAADTLERLTEATIVRNFDDKLERNKTLCDFFAHVGRRLIVETSIEGLRDLLSRTYDPDAFVTDLDARGRWISEIDSYQLEGWLCELAMLDLVISRRGDTERPRESGSSVLRAHHAAIAGQLSVYWSLTSLGKRVLGRIARGVD